MTMAQLWRFTAGPLVTLATVGAILALDRYVFAVPNPGAISFVAVVFATYIGGTASGLVSAAISLAYAAYYFSTPGEFLHFKADNLERMLVLILGTPAIVFMVGTLRWRAERSLRQERAARLAIEEADRDLRRLHASLDRVDDGIVLLDHEMRAQYINRAFRKMWRLPDDIADGKPPFVALMYHGRNTRAYAVPDSDIDAYVAERTEKVRGGDETPMDLRLANGEVIRFKCKALPGGGRMLSYVYVTDLVHHTDALDTLRAAFDKVDYGVLLLNRDLRTEFVNRAACELGGLVEPAPGEKPTFAELIRQVGDNGAYAVSAEALDRYVEERIAWASRGDPNPFELRTTDGRIMRVRCTMLPDGARMLTYTNVTDLVSHAEELESLASTDGLTGLYNRRHFLVLAEAEWARFKRYERPLAMLMIDIDRFKAINDTFGHAAGDKVIVDTAKVCVETSRTSDIVARIGGEEFAILLPETDIESAFVVAERLRRRVAERPAPTGDGPANVTVSIGLAGAIATMSGIDELMKRADEALYAAKRGGRNRVVTVGDIAATAMVGRTRKRVA